MTSSWAVLCTAETEKMTKTLTNEWREWVIATPNEARIMKEFCQHDTGKNVSAACNSAGEVKKAITHCDTVVGANFSVLHGNQWRTLNQGIAECQACMGSYFIAKAVYLKSRGVVDKAALRQLVKDTKVKLKKSKVDEHAPAAMMARLNHLAKGPP